MPRIRVFFLPRLSGQFLLDSNPRHEIVPQKSIDSIPDVWVKLRQWKNN